MIIKKITMQISFGIYFILFSIFFNFQASLGRWGGALCICFVAKDSR